MNQDQIQEQMDRIDEMAQGLFISEAKRALAMLAKGCPARIIAKRIRRDRPYLASRIDWDGKF